VRYTPQFVALLGSEGAATGAARIKSPAFAATLSNGREANGYRAVALGTVLACILVAGSATAVWQFSDNGVRRAPEFAGTLVVAEPSDVAAPSAGAVVFDIQAGVSDPAGQAPSGHLSAPSPIDDPLPRGALQAAVDAAPFRSPILGIATAGLPVGAKALDIAFATSDPSSNSALEANGADGPSTPPSDTSDYGGRSPNSSGEQGGALPSSGSTADDSLGNGGHRESDRPNYVARFAREALRISAAIATVAGRLRPGTAGTPEADSEFDAHSDGAASAEQDSSDATQPAASGSGDQDSGEPATSAKHRGPEPAGGREIVDGSSNNTPSRGAGSQASPGSDDAGRSADGAPNGRGKGAGDSANSGGGSADGSSGLGNGSADAAGSDAAADTSSRNGGGQTQRGKNDNGGSADAPGRGDQEGGDDGGGKEHGGKGHGGKDHGGKGNR
jgi:hypothetical protein